VGNSALVENTACERPRPARAERYAEAIDAAEARVGPGSALAWRGPATLALLRGEFDTARSKTDQWIDRARQLADGDELSSALGHLAYVYGAMGMHVLDRQLAEESLRVARATGIPSALANALGQVPWSLLGEDPERARELLDEAVEVSREVSDALTLAAAVACKGVLPQRSAMSSVWGTATSRPT
jgi:hypothetical protein